MSKYNIQEIKTIINENKLDYFKDLFNKELNYENTSGVIKSENLEEYTISEKSLTFIIKKKLYDLLSLLLSKGSLIDYFSDEIRGNYI